MEVDYKLLGARIKEQRKKAGYTQELMAEKLDVSVGYVSQVERGITHISLDLLARMSTALECDIALLVTGSAVRSDSYLLPEITTRAARLNQRERRMVMDFMELLTRNRT